MTTPEGRVKNNIKEVLDRYGAYYLMPVQHGYGASGVDFHCAIRYGELALAFFIEAKKPGDGPTPRQDEFLTKRRDKQNAMTFIIDDDPSIGEGTGEINLLVGWLEGVRKYNERHDQIERGREFLADNL
jgi:hypothetical protein